MTKQFTFRHRPGAMTIVLVLAITGIVLTALLSISVIATSQVGQTRDITMSDQAFFAAEGGLQDALYKLRSNPSLGNYQIPESILGTLVNINIDHTPGNKSITTQAIGSNDITRKVKIKFNASTFGGFNGAVIAGAGGFELGNGTVVTGDVCANGNIIGGNGSGSTVNGNVQLGPGATISGVITVSGATMQNQSCPFPPLPNYAFTTNSSDPNYSKSFHKAASDGGACAFTSPISGTVEAGPCIFTGNMNFNHNATLVLTGPLWVTGNITGANGVTIKMKDTGNTFAAGTSTVLVAENVLNLNNNSVTLSGIPAQDSFLLAASVHSNISTKNGSASVVFYAANGTITMHNNGTLNNATARMVDIKNGGTITYDSGLGDLVFSGINSTIIKPKVSSWEEL